MKRMTDGTFLVTKKVTTDEAMKTEGATKTMKAMDEMGDNLVRIPSIKTNLNIMNILSLEDEGLIDVEERTEMVQQDLDNQYISKIKAVIKKAEMKKKIGDKKRRMNVWGSTTNDGYKTYVSFDTSSNTPF